MQGEGLRAADSLPYKIWKRSGLFVGADDLGGPRATARGAPTVFCGKVGRRVREAAPYNRGPPERAGEDTRPYGVLYFVGAGHWPACRCTRRVQEAAPYSPAPAATCSAKPGAVLESYRLQFWNSQAPVGRWEFRVPLRFCAPVILQNPAGTRPPLWGAGGKANMSAKRSP